eukprot:m.1299054 g.1299054  ORF g.1299054 m.1299054 type:complete len:51 (-) comp24800_c0_seq11:2829-2981(-)
MARMWEFYGVWLQVYAVYNVYAMMGVSVVPRVGKAWRQWLCACGHGVLRI